MCLACYKEEALMKDFDKLKMYIASGNIAAHNLLYNMQ